MNLRAVPKMFAMIPSVFRGVTLDDLDRIKVIAREAYPGVMQLSTEVLSQWMQRDAPPFLLVDVRAPQEFAVSHLRGAVNLRTVDEITRAAAGRQPSQMILYCSVGFRSSRLAHLVTQRGVRNVLNLEGSIFQWANEEREIYRGEQRAQQIHPYGQRWAGLLKQGLAADC